MEAFSRIMITTQIVELDVSFNPLGNVGITELATIFTRVDTSNKGFNSPRTL